MKTITVFFTRITTLLVVLVLVNTSTATPPGWPASISGDTGFADLGRAIKNEPGFPAKGSQIDKARYVFSRMQDVAQSYGLKSGSGGLVSNIGIGLYRLTTDPENAECLKGKLGWGNCGEWSYAMSEIFSGAAVPNNVAYGDKSGGTGRSLKFTGTDTMVIVEERSPYGVSRRVFDAFRAAYHSGISQPTAKSLQEWGDMPLTDYDKWKDETRQSWQKRVSKPFIKDDRTQSELVLPFPPRIDPSTSNRPVASGIESAILLGCFKDTNNPFDLDGFLERSPSNTPQRCVKICRDKGFSYAGVQYGESCLCGNRYGKYGKLYSCDYKCTGDPKQICGGYYSNSVYAIGRP